MNDKSNRNNVFVFFFLHKKSRSIEQEIKHEQNLPPGVIEVQLKSLYFFFLVLEFEINCSLMCGCFLSILNQINEKILHFN